MATLSGDMHSSYVGISAAPSPPAMQAYKRGVLKPAPREFTVTPLPPAKHGNAYSYGIRITPLRSDTSSVLSARSWSTDYEIWRRWEDCLYFQELLEEEYAQMSRDKRKRLKQGKGIKKDGVYKTSDFAASFESLPPGPNYQDIALDVHQYLPKLTKKGTLFRPSLVLVQQRGKEFESMITALWQEECTTLIKELRELSQIRDFFGFWQRDEDRLRKSGIFVGGGNLYGTTAASSSAVSLVPTLASARTTASSAMFLRMRVPEEPIGQLPVIMDDDFSVVGVAPPYSPTASTIRHGPPSSPRSPRSPRSATMSSRQRPQTSAGEMSFHSTAGVDSRLSGASHQHQPPPSADPTAMRFVLEPSDMMDHQRNSAQNQQQQPQVVLQDPPRRTTTPGASCETPRHRPPELDLVVPSPSNSKMTVRTGGAIPIQVHPPGPPSYSHGLPSPPLSPPRASNNNNAQHPHRPGTSPSPSANNRNFRVVTAENGEPSFCANAAPGYALAPGLHMPKFPPRSTQVHRPQDPIPRPGTAPGLKLHSHNNNNANNTSNSNSRNTPSPTGSSSPPQSATRSLESASSDNPSMFSEEDDAASVSSKRTSWESQNSNGDGQSTLTRGKEQRSQQQGYGGPPVSYERLFKPSHRIASSSSSVDTVQGRPQGRHAASTPPAYRSVSPNETVDLLDTYFDNLTIVRSDSPTLEPPRPPSFVSEYDTVISRESIASIPTSDRFPAPFQNRPPGQFHIPWSPTQSRISLPPSPNPTRDSFGVPMTPPTLSPSASMLSLDPSLSPPSSSSIAIKAIHGDSIVSFRIEKSIALVELRQRIREKLVHQERVPLKGDFVIGYKNPRTPGRIGARARAYSTSTISTVSTIASLGSVDPASLSHLTLEQDWKYLSECCGSKLTLIILEG